MQKTKKALTAQDLMSFFIPFGLIILSMVFLRIAPFGDNTLLLRDAVGQYMDFLSYIKTIFSGENDFFYTFSKTLGGDLISLASYYLLSPFNLLLVFSSNADLPLFFSAVVILKLSLSGVTCYYALEKQFGPRCYHIVLSTAYALMAYCIMYEWNLMWLDGVLILPLMGLGLYQIWNGYAPKLYVFSLGYGLLTNFYIGYMLCIASVLFCMAHCLLYKGMAMERIRILGKYAAASCIGGLSTAFVWLPSFLSLRNGRATFEHSRFSFAINFNPIDFLAKLVAGAGGQQQLDNGLPLVFCGTTVLFFVIVFFLNRKTGIKEKLAALCVVAVFLLSFLIRPLDVIWHGFSPNNSFNFRYSFIFSYVLIMIARHSLSIWEEIDRKTIAGAGIMIGAMLLVVFWKNYHYVPNAGILIGFVVMLQLCVLSFIKNKHFAVVVLLVVGVFEIGANCYLLLDSIVGKVNTVCISEYTAYVESVSPAIDYVKHMDDGFYRMEKTFQRTHNDAMFFGYNGLSHFSSSEHKVVPQFMRKMGYTNYQDIWSYYNKGSTVEADSLLGVKYVLSKTELPETKGYSRINTINGIGIYENTNALPIGIVSSYEIMNVNMNEEDYFALHNAIWNAVTGCPDDMLHKEELYTVTLSNLTEDTDEKGNRIYKKTDISQPSAIEYNIEITKEMPLYFYFRAPLNQNANILINGEDRGLYFDTYCWDMSMAGIYPEGETVTITIIPHDPQITITEPIFYYENLNVLGKQAKKINDGNLNLVQKHSSRFAGNATTDEPCMILFTIPYDTGWRGSVDGKPVQISKVLDTFLAMDIPEGTHELELRYIPKGFYGGCMLTVIALISMLLWEEVNKRTR